MCGRLNVLHDPLCRIVREKFGINFKTTSNRDLRPTQEVATVGLQQGELRQLDLKWGIMPDWANHLIFNARAETVSVKSTFANAFEFNRVIVPCSGWYEWREEEGTKVKYLFSLDNSVLYMAGIELDGSKLVTLTTKANEQCREYHDRMPLLVEPDNAMVWIAGRVEEVYPLLNNEVHDLLTIRSCN